MKNKIDNVITEWLVLSYKAGDKKALTLLVKRWHRILIGKILLFVKDNEAAKDIAQDCWVEVIHSIHKLREPAQFGAWVLKIAGNKSIDWIRQKDKEEKYAATRNGFDDSFHEDQDNKDTMIQKIQLAYKTLTAKERTILSLHYNEGLTIQQITNKTGLKEGTVKSRLFTARNHLKNKIRVL